MVWTPSQPSCAQCQRRPSPASSHSGGPKSPLQPKWRRRCLQPGHNWIAPAFSASALRTCCSASFSACLALALQVSACFLASSALRALAAAASSIFRASSSPRARSAASFAALPRHPSHSHRRQPWPEPLVLPFLLPCGCGLVPPPASRASSDAFSAASPFFRLRGRLFC